MLQFSSKVDFRGYTLVVPSVSVGNVGQLAVDLWISSLNCAKIGYIWHPAIMPVVGGNPFTKSAQPMMTSSELFYDEAKKLVFLQIRSPILKHFLRDFLQQLVSWILSSNIAKVVILTGSSYTEGKDAWITGNKLRYIFSPDLQAENADMLARLQWTTNERVPTDDSSSPTTGHYFLSGCGYALMLHEMCAARGIRVGMLIKFCSEGDNVPDAHELARYLDGWLGAVDAWKTPSSWKLLFGKRTPSSIW